jgi:hypothetical protein
MVRCRHRSRVYPRSALRCASRVNSTCVDRSNLRGGPGSAVHRSTSLRAAPHPGHGVCSLSPGRAEGGRGCKWRRRFTAFRSPHERSDMRESRMSLRSSGLQLSCAGLTRASILLRKTSLRRSMDCRVKPGNDGPHLASVGIKRRRRFTAEGEASTFLATNPLAFIPPRKSHQEAQWSRCR